MQENSRVLMEQLLTNMIGFQFLWQWRLWCAHGNSAIDFYLLTHYGRISHWQGKCFPSPPLWFCDTWKHISFSVLQDLDQSIQRLLCLQWSSTHSLRIWRKKEFTIRQIHIKKVNFKKFNLALYEMYLNFMAVL